MIEILQKENEKLADQPKKERTIEYLESTVKQNPVSVETIAELSATETPVENVLDAIDASRIIFLSYSVTDLDRNHEKELADILTATFVKNVSESQMETIADIYMQGTKEADAETYLRLAAFINCVAIIKQHAAEMKTVPNKKEINRNFMHACADALRNYVPESGYENLLYEERINILKKVIEPLCKNYAEQIGQINQQPAPAM